MRKLLEIIRRWLERRRNLKRFNKDRKDFEAEVGANLRFVEDHINKRRWRS